MSTGFTLPRGGSQSWPSVPLVLLVWLAVGAIALRAAISLPSTPVAPVLLILFGATCVWMFFSPRYELTLPVLLLFLALVDGALRLYTGVGELTLLRDALLYAIVIGAVARMILRGERPKAPPFTGWVVAFTAVTVVQLA